MMMQIVVRSVVDYAAINAVWRDAFDRTAIAEWIRILLPKAAHRAVEAAGMVHDGQWPPNLYIESKVYRYLKPFLDGMSGRHNTAVVIRVNAGPDERWCLILWHLALGDRHGFGVGAWRPKGDASDRRFTGGRTARAWHFRDPLPLDVLGLIAMMGGARHNVVGAWDRVELTDGRTVVRVARDPDGSNGDYRTAMVSRPGFPTLTVPTRDPLGQGEAPATVSDRRAWIGAGLASVLYGNPVRLTRTDLAAALVDAMPWRAWDPEPLGLSQEGRRTFIRTWPFSASVLWDLYVKGKRSDLADLADQMESALALMVMDGWLW